MNYDPNRLRGLLAMRGITIGAIARRLEVSESYVSSQIGGARTMLNTTAAVLRDLLGGEAMTWAARQTDILRLPERVLHAPLSDDAA
jgi:plasmid maintenance system antidote protein VapI